ncbi:hypothetical protein [Hafnia alvei]|uniref:Uncharacterized protein n=1 Tax=Hafnia alvei TaxID=569 RepID=A0A1C6Z0B6_HAFAL|nr:hypothetical protein [Hafnia alvei]SCM52435.1 hypothetical protein BN1044_01919 [Hafnia alvei]
MKHITGLPDNGERLVKVNSDPNTVVNNFAHALSTKDIPESDNL